MIEQVIVFLIYVCLIGVLIYLVLWVLEAVGLAPPPKVIQLLWVIGVLVVLLLLARMFLPRLGVRASEEMNYAEVSWKAEKAWTWSAGINPGKEKELSSSAARAGVDWA